MLLDQPLDSHLLEPNVELPPPSMLKRKIIIKNKKKHHHHHHHKKSSSSQGEPFSPPFFTFHPFSLDSRFESE
jgi:phosphatidylinositol phospholipase C, beta